MDRCISGGRRSRSELPKAFVLIKTLCSLDLLQFPHFTDSELIIAMSGLWKKTWREVYTAEPIV